MPSLGKLFWLNVIAFGLYGITCLLETYLQTSDWLPVIQAPVLVFLSLILFGLNAAVILEKIFRQHFDTLELISLAALIALIFPALLLTMECSSGRVLFSELPILNTLALFLITIWLHPFGLEGRFSVRSLTQTRAFQSGLLACLFYVLLASAIVSAYPALPDSDPYYWLLKIRSEIEGHELASLQLYRPLFSSFVYILSETSNIGIFTVFKYVFPFLLTLVILPAALVARYFTSRLEQLVVFLLPLSSASLILYSEMPIPQSILNIIFAFFVFFLLYSCFSKKDFFYFFAGIPLVLAYFYHEAALLVFLVWLSLTLFWYRSEIRSRLSKNPLVFFLLFFLLLSNTEHATPLFGFIKNWLVRMMQALAVWHTNFSFPLSYVNVDGHSVGWNNGLGIIKYYAFYVGPAVFTSLVFFLFFSRSESTTWQEPWYRKKEIVVLVAGLGLFLTLSEALPRILSVAFLPERSWGFAGLFLLTLTVNTLRLSSPRKSFILSALLLMAILINAGAAIYVNSLKRNLLSPHALDSARWITTHLPKTSTILTEKDWSVLKVFTPFRILDAQDRQFYYNIGPFERILSELSQGQCAPPRDHILQEKLSILSQNAQALQHESSDITQQDLSDKLVQLSYQIEELKVLPISKHSPCPSPQDTYVYYSKENPKNPYADRPYVPTIDTGSDPLIFDLSPERFERIYTAGEDEIIIWKVLQ